VTTDRSEANVADVAEQDLPVLDEGEDDLDAVQLDGEHGSVADQADQLKSVPLDDEDGRG
jgi:hypothetical protein